MRSFIRLALSLFVIGLFIVIFSFIFSPDVRERMRNYEPSLGTVDAQPPLVSPGRQERSPASDGVEKTE